MQKQTLIQVVAVAVYSQSVYLKEEGIGGSDYIEYIKNAVNVPAQKKLMIDQTRGNAAYSIYIYQWIVLEER